MEKASLIVIVFAVLCVMYLNFRLDYTKKELETLKVEYSTLLEKGCKNEN